MMNHLLNKIRRLRVVARRFAKDARGGTATVFAIAFPAILAVAGASVDYANLQGQKARLQAIADGAALAAAKELRLGNASALTATQVAQNYVAARNANINFSASVASDKSSITVNVDLATPTYVAHFYSAASADVTATATAKVVGGQPICAIGLNTSANFTVGLEQQAQLQAPNCSVYSNSTKPNGLFAKNAASLTAAFICSGGGKAGAGPGSFSPSPLTDCPIMPDPLSSRPAPTVGSCSYTNFAVHGGVASLFPGVYCGGITIDSGAIVAVTPGEYIVKDGPLYVGGGASFTGVNVGFYFTGAGAVLDFDADSTISLVAPVLGSLAGILFFEDRSAPVGQTHDILSNDALVLLGTIYLPQGVLHVGSNSLVASQSAYTIVVVNQFSLTAGPTMVLNTNYSSTDVPVPDNLGPNAAKAYLMQ